MSYLDAALTRFLESLPRDGVTMVVLYSDHPSTLFVGSTSVEEATVPMMLGVLAEDGSLAPLGRHGRPVHALPGTYELTALHKYLEDCLDASAR